MRTSSPTMGAKVLAVALGATFVAAAILKLNALSSTAFRKTMIWHAMGESGVAMVALASVEAALGLSIAIGWRRSQSAAILAVGVCAFVLWGAILGSHRVQPACGCFGATNVEERIPISGTFRGAFFVVALLVTAYLFRSNGEASRARGSTTS